MSGTKRSFRFVIVVSLFLCLMVLGVVVAYYMLFFAPAMRTLTLNPVAATRHNAAKRLDPLGRWVAARQLGSQVRSADVKTREGAGRALVSLRVVPPLIEATRDSRPEVRCAAVKYLGQIPDLASVQALSLATKDTESAIRKQAVKSLQQLCEGKARTVSIKARKVLADQAEPLRQRAKQFERQRQWKEAAASWQGVLALLPDDSTVESAIESCKNRADNPVEIVERNDEIFQSGRVLISGKIRNNSPRPVRKIRLTITLMWMLHNITREVTAGDLLGSRTLGPGQTISFSFERNLGPLTWTYGHECPALTFTDIDFEEIGSRP